MEDDEELYTVSDFHSMMSNIGDDTYMLKMTQIKLKEKYGDSMRLVTRNGKSNIILLNRAGDILSENWYRNQRKSNLTDESERIMKTAAILLKEVIKYHDHDTTMYPSASSIISYDSCVPRLLQVFVNELIKSPLKQRSIGQTLFTGVRPRSIMPLQFGLSVAVDNRLASIWLNTLLSKLGFVSSYDDV